MKNPSAEAEPESLRKNRDLRIVRCLVKWWPVVFNTLFALDAVGCVTGLWCFSPYTYVLTGSCLVFACPICYFSSRIFCLCRWHRVLCLSMAGVLILEALRAWNVLHYAYVGDLKINVYIWGTLALSSTGLLIATLHSTRGRKDGKRCKKAVPPILDEDRLRNV